LSDSSHSSSRVIAADPIIFGLSAVSVLFVLGYFIADPPAAGELFSNVQSTIVESFAWLFSVSVTFFLVFVLALAFSSYGKVRLGKQNSEPHYSWMTWFAMLFSAGMGIGLVFYGVAEPIMHYANPPQGAGQTAAAAGQAMEISMFHWGLHAWGIYVALGLALAYSHFRLGNPLSIRYTLTPLLGNQTDRLPGKLIDVIAVFGTLFGLATSLGLGASQISAGLSFLFGLEQTIDAKVWIIIVITLCATVSLVTGLNHGIRRLSELNILLAIALMLFVFVVGPTTYLLRVIPDTLGHYASSVMSLSLNSDVFRPIDWQKSWTIFYWAWWLSWAPFVGTFIARVSAGRTIREFVLGVLLAPTLAAVVWFSIFGGTALQIEVFGGGGIVSAVNADVSTAIFVLLQKLPLFEITSGIACLVVAIFFITSSDSGSFVVDMLTSGGLPNPPIWQRIFWAITEGALASVLLIAGGLGALQAAAINTGLPFCVILLAACYCLWKRLSEEKHHGET